MIKLPLVVEKIKTVKLGGAASILQRQEFAVDLKNQVVADIQNAIIEITIEQVDIQDRLQNPPSSIAVDNSTTTKITDVRAKIEMSFGNQLQAGALRQVELQLSRAIIRATHPRTGKLENMSNWEWLHITDKGAKVVNAKTLDVIGIDEKLYLRPKLAYAGLVNSLIAKRDGTGFMGTASQKVKRSRFFKLFSIYAATTKAFMSPSEYMSNIGSPVIVVRPRRGRYKIRRVKK